MGVNDDIIDKILKMLNLDGGNMEKNLISMRRLAEAAFGEDLYRVSKNAAGLVKTGGLEWYPLIKVILIIMLLNEKYNKENSSTFAELHTTLAKTLDVFADKAGIDLKSAETDSVLDCKKCDRKISTKCLSDFLPEKLGKTCPAYPKGRSKGGDND